MVFKNKTAYHAGLVLAMYLFYAWLWIDKEWLYDGKAGWIGFEMFMTTIYTAPFYFLLHIIIAATAYRSKILLIHLIGLLCCIIHVAAVFSFAF